MATVPSDHAPAELDPGASSPATQPAVFTTQPETFPPGLENPQVLPLPPAGTPSADISPQVPRPGTVSLLRPPIGKGWGVDTKINIDQATQLPLSGVGGAGPNQSNLVPVIPFPVLAREGPNAVSWAGAIPLGGLTTATIRGTYRDLHITPGFRGLQINYVTGSVKIVQNATGMTYVLPTGPHTIFVPLFMLREVFDLTINASAAFPAGTIALLTTEEQLPFIF